MRYCSECSSALPPAAATCPNCRTLVTDSARPAPEPQPARPGWADPDGIRVELAEALRPDFELLRPLGKGGMGWVFLARELALKRLVAVKLLAPHLQFDERSRARFEREARAAAVLSHPNLVQVYRIGEIKSGGLPYIVMQYIEGPSLREWLAERGRAGERDARRILGGVASALASAHARGLVHRDVKPANILVESATGRIFLTDFGIAAALSPAAVGEAVHLTDTNAQVGTPAYMSPEQSLGEPVTPRSDVYGLGMLGYELLAGELPFQASTTAGWTAAHLRDTPLPMAQRRPDLPPELSLLIDRCLYKAVADRPTAEEIARGLLPSLESGVEWPPPGTHSLLGQGHRMGLSGLLVTGAGTVVLLCLAWPPRSTLAQGPWWEQFSADIRESTASPLGLRRIAAALPQETLFRLWEVGLVLGLVLMTLGFLRLLGWARSLVERAQTASQTGWRWPTILDLLADPDGRSGLLLGGEGEFGSIPSEDRRRILLARRQTAGMLMLAGLGLPLLLGAWALWASLPLASLPEPGPLASPVAGFTLIGFPIVVLTVALVAAVREAGLMGPLPRRRLQLAAGTGGGSTAPSQAVVHAWYAAVPTVEAAESTPPAPSRLPAAAFSSVLVLGVAGLAALVLLSSAVLIAARNVRALGPATAELVDTLTAIQSEDPIRAAREVWRSAVGTVASLSAVPDTTGYLVPPGQLLEALGAGSDSITPGERVVGRGIHGELRGDTLRLLEQLTIRVSPLREAAGTATDYPALRAAMQLNLLGAALALQQGREGGGRQWLGRNVALADPLLDSPDPFAATFGAGVLQSYGLLPLALLIEARGDSAGAGRLRQAATRVVGYVSLPAWRTGTIGLAADPGEWGVLSRLVLESRLLPVHRLAVRAGAARAYCLNPREIVTGPNPLRRAISSQLADPLGTPAPGPGETGSWPGVIDRLRNCWNLGKRIS